jgi:hypothetical protein
MLRTITKHHVFSVLNKAGETVANLKLPKNTYSPKAAKKILSENGYDENHKLIYEYPVQEKRELSDEDFIKYSKVVE